MNYKKVLTAVLIILTFVTSAQNLKYSRVLIKGQGKDLFNKLANIGLLPDHDQLSAKGLIAEINQNDIALLKANQMNYDVLIDDLTAYYVNRNINSLKATATLTDCNRSDIKTPTHFHLGSMGGFFTLTEMQNILDSMSLLYPNLITVKQAAGGIQSIEGRNIWYLKISDNPSQDETEPEILYTALHHAREPQSLSQLIFYMWYLLENYNSDAEVKAIVDNTEMFFIPCINPDGYVFNATNSPNGGGMWRKNRRINGGNTFGIDLNRNYGYNWGYDNFGSSPVSNSDVYRGPSAFSEPETQAVRNFCNGRQFKAALNAHSFGNHLIYPWGYIPSLLTNDSIRFNQWGEFLTDKSTYSYGTCDQTLFYITNGSSDDWMYGDLTSKSKIFAFTPETGSAYDGFWPASNRIIDLCKFTFYQNFNLAKLAGSCFVTEDRTDHFLKSNGFIKFNVSNLGLSGNTTTVSLQSLNNDFSIIGQAKVFNNLNPLTSSLDSIAFGLNANVVPGQNVKYLLKINTGSFVHIDTIVKQFGNPIIAFYESGSNFTSNFSQVGTWSTSSSQFVSPPSSIIDSPGLYASNDIKSITMNQVADLSNAVSAHLQFYTKFDIEKFFDQAQILVSTDNGSTFSPLCTPHQTSPRSNDASEPIYDYRRDNWVKEEIDLKSYLGMGIVLRFELKTDGGNEKDGIYIDDILVRKLITSTTGIHKNGFESNQNIYPNPSNGFFNLNADCLGQSFQIYNSIGELVFSKLNTNHNNIIDLTDLPAGIYLASFSHGNKQKLVIEH